MGILRYRELEGRAHIAIALDILMSLEYEQKAKGYLPVRLKKKKSVMEQFSVFSSKLIHRSARTVDELSS